MGVPISHQAAVAAGSAMGALARFAASLSAISLLGPAFPWGTLTVNVLGSLMIGAYAAAMTMDGRWWSSPLARHFVTAGFCGGFTTFSIFSLETFVLVDAGLPGRAAAYVAASLLLWMAGVWAGYALARRLAGRADAGGP